MKKINLFLFLFIGISSVSAWESNITIDCINENLEQCSSSNMTSNKSNESSDINLNKFEKKKKKVVKKIVNKNEKEKIVKKKPQKKKKKILTKKVKKKEKKVVKKKVKVVSVKNNNISFEKFKNFIKNYSNTSGYPDIN